MKRALTGLALIFSALLPIHAARAAQVVSTTNFTETYFYPFSQRQGLNDGRSTLSFQFNPFDTQLGTLTRASLFYQADSDFDANVIRFNITQVTPAIRYTLSGPLGGVIAPPPAIGCILRGNPLQMLIGRCQRSFNTPTELVADTVLANDLALFGGPAPIDFTLDFDYFLNPRFFADGNGGVDDGTRSDTRGALTLVYDYDPRVIGSGVPEPESWALMIAGFGLVGAGMRRRQPQGKAPIA
jgi:hypothetical protein